MMTTRMFRPYDPEELWLLPPSPRDWLPTDYLAYFLSDLVDELDLKPILETYRGVTRGTVPYHPQLLVKVLLYAYAVGVPKAQHNFTDPESRIMPASDAKGSSVQGYKLPSGC